MARRKAAEAEPNPGTESVVEVAPWAVVYTDTRGRPWLVSATFAKVNDRMEVAGMEVRGYTIPGDAERFLGARLSDYLPTKKGADADAIPPLDSTVWRAAGGLMRLIRRQYVAALVDSGLADRPQNARAMRSWTSARERRAGELEHVAELYQAEVDAAEREGRRPRPLVVVAEALGVSRETAKKTVMKARTAGHLPPTTRGRATGAK